MGLFTNIGQKISGGLNAIGQKVGSAVSKVGSKVSKYAGIGAQVAGKLAMGAALVQPELAPVFGAAAAGLRTVQGIADVASAGGRALQQGDVVGAFQAGKEVVNQSRAGAQAASRAAFGVYSPM